MKYRISSLIMCITIIISSVPVYSETIIEEVMTEEIVEIYDVETLLQFEADCAVDGYSRGKTFVLLDDIDISESDFTGIPSFGGKFIGGGHTIKGYKYNEEGSHYGFFRYIQTSGLVSDLLVQGVVTPEGTRTYLGGFVGHNSGTLESCSFSGSVIGKGYVGGLAGVNEETGVIKDCYTIGLIYGEHFTGGIAGANLGIISNTINNAKVNVTVQEETFAIDEIDMDQLQNGEGMFSHTDTGGIAGLNTGTLDGCVNGGEIGYPHVGYNVGGIAGRQSGFIKNCYNEELIQGRKDVGGIVGQMEPDMLLRFQQDVLDDLSTEVEQLQVDINNALDHAEYYSDEVLDAFEQLNQTASNASDHLEVLTDDTTRYVDDTTLVINDLLERVDEIIESAEPAVEEMRLASEDVTEALYQMELAFYELSEASAYMEHGFLDMEYAFSDMADGIGMVNLGIKEFESAMVALERAADSAQLIAALEDLENGLVSMNKGIVAISTASNDLITAFSESGDGNVEDLTRDIIATTGSAVDYFNNSQNYFDSGFTKLQDEIKKDSADVTLAMNDMRQGFSYISDGMVKFQQSAWGFEAAMKEMGYASDSAGAAMDRFAVSMEYMSLASDHLSVGLSSVEVALEKQIEKEDLKLPLLGDRVNKSSDAFYEAVDLISGDVSALNDALSTSNDVVLEDMRIIGDQVFLILDFLEKTKESMMASKEDPFVDLSDELVLKQFFVVDETNKEMEAKAGYVLLSTNKGKVVGDINVGGVAGSIAIEYDFDPESDYTQKGTQSLDYQFQTMAVMAFCNNTGSIESKKDNVGGIVGLMELGSLIECDNTSEVTSTNGRYVGGIAGNSTGVIRNSSSLSRLSGISYLGGISGFASHLYNNYAIVSIIDGEEYIGGVSGYADFEEGVFANNYFVSEELHGIDGVSYVDLAEQKIFDDFLSDELSSEIFGEMQVRFKAGEETIMVYDFDYGTHLDLDELPEIPKREGYYSYWPDYHYDHLTFPETIEAVYEPYIQALQSSSSVSDRAILLVEGAFTPETYVTLEAQSIAEFTSKNLVRVYDRQKAEVVGNNLLTDVTGGYVFRYYYPDDENVDIFVKSGESWVEVESFRDGSYLVFPFEGNCVDFAVGMKIVQEWSVSGALLLVGGVVGLIVFFRRMKKRKKLKTA